jgi:hypothetical protein
MGTTGPMLYMITIFGEIKLALFLEKKQKDEIVA